MRDIDVDGLWRVLVASFDVFARARNGPEPADAAAEVAYVLEHVPAALEQVTQGRPIEAEGDRYETPAEFWVEHVLDRADDCPLAQDWLRAELPDRITPAGSPRSAPTTPGA